MKKLIEFFIKIGRLRKMVRRGWILIGAKEPASISDHLFRVAMMSWILSKGKKVDFDMTKAIKIALIHDLCELYAGDLTPYDTDSVLPKDKEKWPELFDKWPRFSKEDKERIASERHQKEKESLEKILKDLPSEMADELKGLWLEYESGVSKEARFVKQVNRLETLLQALEYGKEENKRPFKSWWIGTKERIDDPLLLEFMEALDQSFPFFK